MNIYGSITIHVADLRDGRLPDASGLHVRIELGHDLPAVDWQRVGRWFCDAASIDVHGSPSAVRFVVAELTYATAACKAVVR